MDSRDDKAVQDADLIIDIARQLGWSEKRLKEACKKLLEVIRYRDEAKRKPLH